MENTLGIETIDKTFSWALELVKIGPLGFGGLVFAAAFLVLIFSIIFKANLNKDMSRLVRTFMWLGTACFLISIGAVFLEGYLKSSHNVNVVFSPNFVANGLPDPKILVGSVSASPEVEFGIAKDTTINIGVDEIIRKVRELERETQSSQRELIATQAELQTTSASLVEANAELADNSRAAAELADRVQILQRSIAVNPQVSPTLRADFELIYRDLNGMGNPRFLPR